MGLTNSGVSVACRLLDVENWSDASSLRPQLNVWVMVAMLENYWHGGLGAVEGVF